MKNDYYEQRKNLQFIELTTKYFQFLSDEFGYTQASADIYLICYRKERIEIRIWHERVSYEFYIVVQTKNKSILLGQLLNRQGLPTRFYQGSTKSNVDFCLKELSKELRLIMDKGYLKNSATLLKFISD